LDGERAVHDDGKRLVNDFVKLSSEGDDYCDSIDFHCRLSITSIAVMG
jgi:hypothetical protein